MPVMPDSWIRRMATEHGMIEPFTETQKREGVISYGLSSYGYDARVSDEFRIFTNVDKRGGGPEGFPRRKFRDPHRPGGDHSPQQFRTGAHHRIFPHSA